MLVIEPREFVIVGVLQLSVAVAAPAPGTPVGLQPRSLPAGQKVNVGGVTSDTETGRLQELVQLLASVTTNDNV